jgi:diguanylate cyclase (GGDEF)-like protein
MPVDAFYISLVNEQENVMEDVYLVDLGKRYPNERASLSTPSITMQVVNSRQSLLIMDDADGISREIGTTIYGTKDDTRSILIVPLIKKDEVIGVISAQHYQPNMYTPIHTQILELLANQVAIAILNARLHATLQQEAIQDPLTGMFNRRFMEESLEKELMRAKRSKQSFGVALLDIDHFKRVNDQHGHDAGDAVLCLFAKLLEESIRSGDIACRYGGEEFALILPGVSQDNALQRMEQLRRDTNRIPFKYQEKTTISLTCSIGIATFPRHGATSGVLLRAADKALYYAKKNGRNQVAEAE